MGAIRALAISTGVSLGAYLGLGFPGWLAAGVGVLGFLGFGGLQWTKLVISTLPRDLKGVLRLMKLIRYMKANGKKSVSELFTAQVERHPDKVAILFEDQIWTFRQLDNYANQVANFFQDFGVKPGDTVVIFMMNCPQFLGVSLGLSKLGVTGSFINFNLRGNALLHCIKICDAVAIVHDVSLSDAIQDIHDKLDIHLSDACYAINGDPTNSNSQPFDSEIRKFPTTAPPAIKTDIETTDTLGRYCFIYTSGTTGLPKAVHIRHQKFLSISVGMTFVGGINEDDTVYCALPLYHTNGGILAAGQMLLRGSTLALRRKFSASQFWNDCIKYRVTVIFYIGEFCRYLLAQPPRPTDKQHMVRMATGNGLRKHIWKEFQTRFNISYIAEFYGSTEGNSNLLNVEGVVGSCGFKSVLIPKAIPVYILLVDPETGELVRDSNGFCIEAPVGETGELVGLIRNNFMRRFDGYKNTDATNKKILRDVFQTGDRYFRTGDMMYMDERGSLYFADRTGDTFRWKGENVSTSEVETLMAKVLPKDVHVAVFGVDVPNTEGKAGMAVIESDPVTCDVSKLASKLFPVLPVYAVPLFLRFVDKIEMTGTHKYKKTNYCKEQFDIKKISDPVYILDSKVYVPLTDDICSSIAQGTWRI